MSSRFSSPLSRRKNAIENPNSRGTARKKYPAPGAPQVHPETIKKRRVVTAALPHLPRRDSFASFFNVDMLFIRLAVNGVLWFNKVVTVY